MSIVQNRKSLWSYDRIEKIASSAVALLANIQFSGASGPYELSLRLGISDLKAWGAGSFFLIDHNGKGLITIDDQLADLLHPLPIPVEMTGKDSISISFYNGSAAPVNAASVMRLDKS